MTHLLVQNCDLLQLTELKPEIQKGQDLLIEGQRITRIGPTGSLNEGPDTQKIQADGLLACPGLINCHAHVPMGIFRGLAEDVNLETWFNEYMWPLESNLTEEDVYWGMQLGLAEMIEAGVTAVADHYFHMDRAAEAVAQAGTRAALGWAVFGNQGQQALELSSEFITRHQGTAQGRITTWMAPHAPYTCDEKFLSQAARQAQELGVGIHIHASETVAQTQASLKEHGRTPIQILDDAGVLDGPTILAHCCGATAEDMELMAQKSCGVAHAPKTYLKLSMGSAPVLAMRQAGIEVGLASDGPVSNNTLDILESLRLMAMVQKHESGAPENMTVAQALNIAFEGSARVFGLANDLGRLEPGRLADLILVDMSGVHNQPPHNPAANLVYSTRASDVQTVIVDGKLIMKNRELLTLDKKEIVKQVGRSMERLSRRVPDSRIQLYRP